MLYYALMFLVVGLMAGVLNFLGVAGVGAKGGDQGTSTNNRLSLLDLNGDGKIDLAVTNGGPMSNAVSIWTGNGDGTFGPHSDVATELHPTAAAIADLDGNGFLDLAVVNTDSSSVSLLLGSGDGTFAPQTVVKVGHQPGGIAAGNLNGDGSPVNAQSN